MYSAFGISAFLNMELIDTVAIITGAATGIGRATALLLAEKGANVVVNYHSKKNDAESVVKEITTNGGKAVAVQADISKPEDVKRLFKETLEQYERLTILVNNAGILHDKPFLETVLEDWQNIFATNLFGTMLCSQEAAKIMKKQNHGSIVNIASIRGLPNAGRPGIMDYSVSKAGIISFTKTLAKELAPHIRLNAVAPGFTDTDMAKGLEKMVQEETLLERYIQPEEIAQAVCFLAGPNAAGITGEVLVVDAGYQLK